MRHFESATPPTSLHNGKGNEGTWWALGFRYRGGHQETVAFSAAMVCLTNTTSADVWHASALGPAAAVDVRESSVSRAGPLAAMAALSEMLGINNIQFFRPAENDDYRVRYVHKVTQNPADGPGERIKIPGLPAAMNKWHTTQQQNLARTTYPEVARALREAGVLAAGARITGISESYVGGRICVFPALPRSTTYSHSIIIHKM